MLLFLGKAAGVKKQVKRSLPLISDKGSLLNTATNISLWPAILMREYILILFRTHQANDNLKM